MATKSAISFGLVHIPISLHTAARDNDISFNQLHIQDHERARYKKVCGHCGKEVTSGASSRVTSTTKTNMCVFLKTARLKVLSSQSSAF